MYPEVNQKQAEKYLGYQDKVDINEFEQDITVFDSHGIKIIYKESLTDMLLLEEELLKIGTFYIDHHEFAY